VCLGEGDPWALPRRLVPVFGARRYRNLRDAQERDHRPFALALRHEQPGGGAGLVLQARKPPSLHRLAGPACILAAIRAAHATMSDTPAAPLGTIRTTAAASPSRQGVMKYAPTTSPSPTQVRNFDLAASAIENSQNQRVLSTGAWPQSKTVCNGVVVCPDVYTYSWGINRRVLAPDPCMAVTASR
jgi:hypothetical protein